MTLVELAQKLRPYIEKAALSLSDEEALEAVDLFPKWEPNHGKYFVDDKVRYEGILYRCLQEHISQDGWTPIAVASLWAKVLIPDSNIVPEWEQPNSTNPYQKGDRASYNGHIYESTINGNVWAPDVYGWTLVE